MIAETETQPASHRSAYWKWCGAAIAFVLLGWLVSTTITAVIVARDAPQAGGRFAGGSDRLSTPTHPMGYQYLAIWQEVDHAPKLLQALFFPRPYTVEEMDVSHPKMLSTIPGKPRGRETQNPSQIEIEMLPSGLYLDGIRVTTTPLNRVFVLGFDRKLVSIPMSSQELEMLTPEFVKRSLVTSPLWQSKFAPLIDPHPPAEVPASQEHLLTLDMKSDAGFGWMSCAQYGGGDFLSGRSSDPEHLRSLVRGVIISKQRRPQGGRIEEDEIPGQLKTYKELEELWKQNNIDNIWITPNGLWVNGVSLEQRQFAVILDDGTVEILNLTAAEQRTLTPKVVMESLKTTNFYKSRILPLMQKRVESPAK